MKFAVETKIISLKRGIANCEKVNGDQVCKVKFILTLPHIIEQFKIKR